MTVTASQISDLRAGLAACRVPDHLRDGLEGHCLYGQATGQFLTACLSNDLLEAVSRGDEVSLAGLRPIMQFLYGYAHPACWKSAQNVREWRERGGISKSEWRA